MRVIRANYQIMSVLLSLSPSLSPSSSLFLQCLPLWYDEDTRGNRHVDQDIVEEHRQWHSTC